MIPTRQQVQDKIDEVKVGSSSQEQVKDAIEQWLIATNCPPSDRDKILDDLRSYPNY